MPLTFSLEDEEEATRGVNYAVGVVEGVTPMRPGVAMSSSLVLKAAANYYFRFRRRFCCRIEI